MNHMVHADLNVVTHIHDLEAKNGLFDINGTVGVHDSRAGFWRKFVHESRTNRARLARDRILARARHFAYRSSVV